MTRVNGVNYLGAVEWYFYLNRRHSKCPNSIPTTYCFDADLWSWSHHFFALVPKCLDTPNTTLSSLMSSITTSPHGQLQEVSIRVRTQE